MLAPAAADVLQPVRHAPARQPSQALERQGRPRSVATEPLAAQIVASGDAHAGVQVEAVEVDRQRRSVRRGVIGIMRHRIDVRQRAHLAASDGDRGARVECRLAIRHVAALVDRSLVQVAVAP